MQTRTQKISLLTGLVVVLAIAGVAGWQYYSAQQREQLLAKYRQDPERARFVEQLEKDYEDLISAENDSRRYSVISDIGLQWYILGEYEEAVKYWEKSTVLIPENHLGWYNLGNAHHKLKDYRAAEAAYRRSVEVSRVNAAEIEPCLMLGAMYHHDYTEKADEEPKVYLECLEKNPNNWDLIAALATYYEEKGDILNAIRQYDRLFSLEPGNIQVSEALRRLRLQLEGQPPL